MNSIPTFRAAAFAALFTVGACSGDPSGPQVRIQSGALDLPSISEVCYTLTVYNGDPAADSPDVVWSTPAVCSSQYGNNGGGDITYVGPCDADVAPRHNYVALSLDQVYADGALLYDQLTVPSGGDADFENPCPQNKECILDFECLENQDVFVEFNLTIMRDAEQGFFDIAVNFEDVFCSAKVDSCYALNEPIELLFGDDVKDGVGRDHTAVAAVACTAGPDTATNLFDTHLLFTTKTVTCDQATFTLDPVAAIEGNLVATSGSYTLHYAHYFGAEQLNCGEDGVPLSCNKTFYNTSIDIENLAGQGLTNCALSFHATAIASDDTDSFDEASGKFSLDGGLYGAILVDSVKLTDGTGPICNAHPLNGEDLAGLPSGVAAQYVGTLGAANPAFCFHSDNGGPLAAFPGCGAPACGEHCRTCEPWGGTLTCVDAPDGAISCSGTGARPNTEIYLVAYEPNTLPEDLPVPAFGGGRSDADGNFQFPPAVPFLPGPYYVFQASSIPETNEEILAGDSGNRCTSCVDGFVLDGFGKCIAPPIE